MYRALETAYSQYLSFRLSVASIKNRNFSATRPWWSKRIGGCNAFMKLQVLSRGCKSLPASGESARAGNESGAWQGNTVGEA